MSDVIDILSNAAFWVATLRIATPLILGTLGVLLCERAGVRLGVTLQHRFRPAARKAAALLRAGELGPIVTCSASIRVWRPQAYYDQPGRGTRVEVTFPLLAITVMVVI